jgi:heme/copper-type cytochrome/quinol oxidase subunit 2
MLGLAATGTVLASVTDAGAMPMWMQGPDAWKQSFLMWLITLATIVVLAFAGSSVVAEVRRYRLRQRSRPLRAESRPPAMSRVRPERDNRSRVRRKSEPRDQTKP